MTVKHSATRRYLALFFPFLQAERVMKFGNAPHESVFALVKNVHGIRQLVAVSQAAYNMGIKPGLSLTDARLKLPDLRIVQDNPASDLRALDTIAEYCDRYSPILAVRIPDALVIDITGCTNLFSGEAELVADITRRIEQLGFRAVAGLASTPDAAFAFARFGREVDRLEMLPITALETDPVCHRALQHAGLKTIADLLCHSRASLASRFGTKMIVMLERLLGEEDVRVTPRLTPPELQFTKRFVESVLSVEFAFMALDQLVIEATAVLAEHGLGGRAFEAIFFRSDGKNLQLVTKSTFATHDHIIISRLFHESIKQLNDPLDPGFGLDFIRLSIPTVESVSAHQLSMEDSQQKQLEVHTLIDRLSTRLGSGCVRWFKVGNSHVPEQMSYDVSDKDASSSEWFNTEAGHTPSRPIYQFSPPERIDVIAKVPEGSPMLFTWRKKRYRIAHSEGPECITEEWWRRNDAYVVARDYYRVEDKKGYRFWVFRSTVTNNVKYLSEWYLQGCFA